MCVSWSFSPLHFVHCFCMLAAPATQSSSDSPKSWMIVVFIAIHRGYSLIWKPAFYRDRYQYIHIYKYLTKKWKAKLELELYMFFKTDNYDFLIWPKSWASIERKKIDLPSPPREKKTLMTLPHTHTHTVAHSFSYHCSFKLYVVIINMYSHHFHPLAMSIIMLSKF